VELRAGANSNAAVRDNVARLTPLPSSAQPEVMFMGVLAGGHKAVFALSSGVGHQGQGDCRPHRQMCSELLLGAGQTEQLTFTNAAGAKQRLTLRVVAVHSTVTHSHATAVAAYERHSAAGQCELDLAAPMAYSQSQGTLSAAASTTCKGQSGAVAFPSVAKGQ
jgi:hypothetical protein